MNIINYSDIDFNRLDKYNQGRFSKSDFYLLDRELLYKIYDKENNDKKEVLEAYDSLNKDYIAKTSSLIMDKGVKGNITKFYEADNLSTLINKKGILNMMKVLLTASKNLEDLHNSDGYPIIGDMHFGNIIVDKNSKPIFVDVDSYGINDISPQCIPGVTSNYLNYTYNDVEKNQNIDRLSFLLNLFNIIFKKNILMLDNSIYKDYIYLYPFLENLYNEFIKIKYSSDIPDVPYLHYVLKKDNDF